MVACEVWGLVYTIGVVNTFKSAKDSLSLQFSSEETYMSTFFNGIFFSNQYGLCNSVSGTLFWNFVFYYCPQNIQESYCRECAVYGTGDCPADQNTCFASDKQQSPTCPYMLCREGVLSYAVTRLGYFDDNRITCLIYCSQFEYCLIGLASFQVIMMGIVLSVIIHYNAKKHRWSIIKIVDKRNNRVVPSPVEASEMMQFIN